MFRNMRRCKQELSYDEIVQIFCRNTAGTLALLGDDGYPYSVPISYVFDTDVIIFHSAKAGHKIDAIKNYNKGSFSVIDQDLIVPEEYTTYFRSAIAFGRISIIEDEKEKLDAINLLGAKYRPEHEEERKKEISKEFSALCVVKLEIQHMTGKEAIELRKQNL